MGLRWVSDGFQMGFRCPDGFQMGFRWVSDGFQMGFRWVSDGFQMGPQKHPKILTWGSLASWGGCLGSAKASCGSYVRQGGKGLGGR